MRVFPLTLSTRLLREAESQTRARKRKQSSGADLKNNLERERERPEKNVGHEISLGAQSALAMLNCNPRLWHTARGNEAPLVETSSQRAIRVRCTYRGISFG